jgi:hypothetical protein
LTFQNSTNILYQVGINASGFVVVLNNANTIIATSTAPIAYSQWYYLEAHLLVNAAGTIEVRLHNTPIITFVGDTSYGGAYSDFDRICWYSGQFFQDVYLNDASGAANNTWEGEITSTHRLPTGDGSTIQWTPLAGPNNYTEVDDPLPNFDFDGSYNQANTVGARDLFTKPPLTLITGQSIKAVQNTVFARKVDPGTRKIALVTKSGPTVSLSPDLDLASTYGEVRATFLVDPNTGLPWTAAAYNAAEIGYEITV